MMMTKTITKIIFTAFIIFTVFICTAQSKAKNSGRLYVGWAKADITPERPVNLVGQMKRRIAWLIHDPLTATVLALETVNQQGQKEQAIMVSCDLVWSRKLQLEELRAAVASKVNDIDLDKLFINATHTHTAPGMVDGTSKGLYDTTSSARLYIRAF